MTTSIQKDALLSQFSVLAYKDEAFLSNTANLPTGWELKDSDVQPPFAAFAFRNMATGEVVIAFRGTDGIGDGSADLSILNGTWDPQFQNGMDFVASARRNPDLFPAGFDQSNLLVTGHSLGGAIAQIVAQAYGLDGSTIDPGAAARIVSTAEFQAAALAAGLPANGLGVAASFTNHLVVDSAVSGGTGEHIGQISYVPSLSFNNEQALTTFLIGVANPVAGFAYAVATDQFSNKHNSDQISQALQLMAGVGEGGAVGSASFNLTRKVTGSSIDPITGESKPVYSQTEFEVRNAAGELQSTVRFSGNGTDRQFEVFDAAGALKSTTTLSPSGAVTVQPVLGDSIVVAYIPENHVNEDGTITTINRSPNGNITSTSTTLTYEDGSATQTTRYADGHTTRTNTDENNTITSRANIEYNDSGRIETVVYADGHAVKLTYDTDGQLVSQQPIENGSQTLTTALSTTADALNLIQAIQTGQPLPIVTSGLKLANTLDGSPQISNLSGAASVGGGIMSLMSLESALQRGDTLATVTAGAQAVGFAASAYTAFGNGDTAVGTFLNGTPANYAADGTLISGGPASSALAYIGLVNDIANGNAAGTALDVLAMVQPEIGIPLQIAYSIFNMIFGDDSPPAAWGSGSYVWNGTGISVSASGESGGDQAVSGVMNNVLSTMNSLIAQEKQQNPGSDLGIIPNRMPTLGYGTDGYRFTDIDPLTGVQKNPSLRFDTTGKPYNATPGTDAAFTNLGQAFLNSALARDAIAPIWEVQTAAKQTQIGDPQAGLTEEERAGRAGDLAAPASGTTQTWRPVVLDLTGGGINTVSAAQSGVAFNVDGSGYLKDTAWIAPNDAFLTLDLNYNGRIDSGTEMFSNSAVGLDRRGVASLAWVDANDDGVINSLDPVYNELKIWQDANGNGQVGAGELKTLAQAGITALNYAMGTYTQNGVTRQMASPDLTADTAGARATVIPQGILLQNSNGQTSLIVTRVTDLTAVQAHDDAENGTENVALHIAVADLLRNDTFGGLTIPNLVLGSVANAQHGSAVLNGAYIDFTPGPNYVGSNAGFSYVAKGPNGQTASATVTIALQAGTPLPPSLVANNDSFGTTKNTPLVIHSAALLANDTFKGLTGQSLTLLSVGNKMDGNGTVSYDAGSDTITFTPTANFVGNNASFNYAVYDPDGDVANATAVVAVTQPAASLTVNNDSFSTTENTPLALQSAALLTNDTFNGLTGQNLTLLNVGSNSDGNGTASYDASTNTITFTPTAGYVGNNASFNYSVLAPDGEVSSATVQVAVTQPSVVLTANNDSQSTPENTPLVIHSAALLANDTLNGQTGQNLSLLSVGNNYDGTVVYDPNADTITFTPSTDYVGNSASFDYTVQAPGGQIASATVQINVTVPGDSGSGSGGGTQLPPLFANPDSKPDGIENIEMSILSSSLLSNDSYAGVVGSPLLSLDSISGIQHGSAFIDANKNVQFTPETNYYGSGAGFTYTVKAPDGQTASSSVQISLTHVDQAPTIATVTHDTSAIYGYSPFYNAGGGVYYISSNDGPQYADPWEEYYIALPAGYTGPTAVWGWICFPPDISASNYWTSNPNPSGLLYNFTPPAPTGSFGMGGYAVHTPYWSYEPQYQHSSDSNFVFGYVDHATPLGYDDPGSGQIVATDADNAPSELHYSIVGQPQFGSVTIDGTGHYLYTELRDAPNSLGGNYLSVSNPSDPLFPLHAPGDPETQDSFKVQVTDPSGLSVTQTVYVTHYGTYTPPAPPGGGGGGCCPVVIDLANQGISFTPVDQSQVFFDVNGDGWKHRMSWIKPGEGLLAYDPNGTGTVTDVSQVSFARYLPGAQTDLEGLAAFDSNHDGVLDRNDAAWSKFGIWQDANQNGICDTGEFKTLDQLGVASISLASDKQFSVVNGNSIEGNTLVSMSDGTTRHAADTVLAYSNDVQVMHSDGTSSVVNMPPFSPSGTEVDGTNGNDLLLGYTGNTHIKTLNGNDVVFSGDGNDLIEAGDGKDVIYAGNGTDVITAGKGDDVVYTGTGFDLIILGDGNDAVFAGGGNDVIFVGNGNDLINGGTGNDVIRAGDGNDTIYAGNGNTAMFAGNGDNLLVGGDGINRFQVGNGNDTMIAGTGLATMIGGTGTNTFVINNIGDVIQVQAGSTNTVKSSISYVLPDNIQNLILTGSADLTGTGNALDNVITGGDGHDTLTAGAGNDTLIAGTGTSTLVGGSGNDTFVVNNAADVVQAKAGGINTIQTSVSYTASANVQNLTGTGSAALTLTGNNLNNTITANSGNDTLVAGSGVATLIGGTGSDTFVVNNTADVVQAKAGGTNTIQTSVSYTASANVQNLTGTGSADLTLTGNGLNNVITANSGNDTLIAGTGVAVLIGGAGNDTFVVNNTSDVVQAQAGGTSIINTSVSYTASANVQNLTGTGSAALTLTGNSLNNTITANSGNDTLVAGSGVATLVGGTGNDTFVVNNAADVVQAHAGGVNTVQTSVSITADTNIQNLAGTGSADLTLTGNSLNNTITANSGNDTLIAGSGVATLIGGSGNNTFVVNNVNDVVTEQPNGGIDTILASVSYILSANVENLMLTGSADLTATGNDLNNSITANSGNDTLIAGTGIATLVGGVGNDTFVINNTSDVVQAQAGGTNTIQTSVSYTASPNVQNLTGTGSAALTLTGNSLNNTITANSGNDTLIAGSGIATLIGGTGNDTFVINNTSDVVQAQTGGINTIQTSVSYTASANVQNLTGTGSAALTLTGNNLGNTITANSGNDTLVAGTGVATLIGGTGSDTFVVNNTADVVQAQAGGTNIINSSVSFTASANVLNLTGTGSADLALTGNGLNNTITANTGNDTLIAGMGVATLIGGSGNDTFVINNTSDIVQAQATGTNTIKTSVSYTASTNVQNLTGTGSADLTLTGNGLNNVITSNSGNDTLIAGSGVATLVGGSGNNTFVINNANDFVIEQPNGGIDTILASISYVLPANVENLTLTGSADLTATGNNLNNTITANSGNDTLIAGTGVATLIGGVGNDTFVVDNTADVVQAQAGGTNVIKTSVSYTASANVQNLIGTGSADLTLTGNSLNNVITSNTGNDTLVAGSGVATLVGGGGNNTFVINNANDFVIEQPNGGIDTILASISYVLPANVENLTLTGAADLTATGNDLNNTITANSGNDTLIAGSGIATLIGGTGNDTFVINNTSDVVQAQTGGINTIQTSVSYTASASVQNLTGTGSATLTLTGNNLNNTITANSGNDTLIAGSGIATLIGGTGNDTFVINNTSDVVQAKAGGINTIQTSVSYTASANVQNLTGTGSAALTLTGNNLSNTITANSGNDTLVAGTGVATLIGGAGNDTFVVNNTSDVVQAQAGGTNTIQTSVNYTASANVQNLTGIGSAALSLTGNSLNNTITANSGNDTLIAGSGIATLIGGTGNDTFVINNTSDVVQAQTGGINTIQTSVSYTASANVQNLTGTGSAALTLTGNNLGNTITANSGNDTLVAGTGVATLIGGTGSDTFVVNNTSDVVQAKAGGINTIQTSVSYTAGANVQNLTGTGSAALTLTGNSLNNVITANSGNDVLIGGGGNDTFVTGTGNDTITGGTGNDTYVYNLGNGLDSITDTGGNNIAKLGAGLTLQNTVIRLTNADGTPYSVSTSCLLNFLTLPKPTTLTAHVRVLDANGVAQSNQGMDFTVTVDSFGNITSPLQNFQFADGSSKSFSDMLVKQDVISGVFSSGPIVTGRNDDAVYAGLLTSSVTLGSGNDTVFASAGGTLVNGGGGTDYMIGCSIIGNDNFNGGYGLSIMEAGAAHDTLTDTKGKAAMLGGLGGDTMTGGAANNFFASGLGNDVISTGATKSVVAFNFGDGQDTILASPGGASTLSLGFGINEGGLSFSKSGNDLTLSVGWGSKITFKDWYANAANHDFVTLQVIEDASLTYNSNSTNALLNKRIEDFDFAKLVSQFDVARTANPNLSSWTLMNGLLSSQLASSDTAALGGDLAYQYGHRGSLIGMDLSAVQAALTNPQFGQTAQTLNSWSSVSKTLNTIA